MKPHRLAAAFSVLGIVLWWVVAGLGNRLDAQQPAKQRPAEVAKGGQEGVHVLTRGPVHEAFAETVTFDPEPGIVVPKAPRDLIEEVPPAVRPEGINVTWIPGYWGWDDERDDFLWVSGIWRALPPGRQWEPGYWAKSGQGYQWTSGYWADGDASEIEYLPEPPESVEAGPNVEPSSPDHMWISGCWLWQNGRYAWRPGYYAAVHTDWVWVPDHYRHAARGYVFVDGYWDYSVDRRGVLFAPVYFDSSVYSRRGFYYSPSTMIDLLAFTDHLFLRPRYHHYYFGDYYGSSYFDSGFYPWFSFHGHHGYDPIFAHHRWRHRQDRDWEHRVKANFEQRRDHEESRPPRTLAAQKELIASGKSKDKSHVVATPLDQVAKSKDSPMRFQPVNKDEQQKLAKHGQEVQKTREERQKLEAKTADTSDDKPSKKVEPTKMKLPKSPIVAKSAKQLSKDQAPPQRHETPKPDSKVQPKPRGESKGKAGGESKGDKRKK